MRALLATLFALAVTSPALAEWPKIMAGAETPHCAEALTLARREFRGTDWLGDPADFPPDLHVALQLQPGENDSDQPKTVDSVLFGKGATQNGADPSFTYRQTQSREAGRWLLSGTERGWHGYAYRLSFAPDHGKPAALATDTWTSPILFASSDDIWALDVGDSWTPIQTWRVLEGRGGSAAESCAIAFGPAVKDPLSLLPAPVRRYARSLDGALGSGMNEGTLEPTARLRVAAARNWADAALRPWALVVVPYNTRAEVETDLRHWSRQAPSFRRLYDDIQAQSAPAHRALARFYEQRFHRTPRAAKAQADYVLDVVPRGLFSFHAADATVRLGPDWAAQAPKNPWQ